MHSAESAMQRPVNMPDHQMYDSKSALKHTAMQVAPFLCRYVEGGDVREARQTLIDILGSKADAAQQYSLAVKHMIRGVLEVCMYLKHCLWHRCSGVDRDHLKLMHTSSFLFACCCLPAAVHQACFPVYPQTPGPKETSQARQACASRQAIT